MRSNKKEICLENQLVTVFLTVNQTRDKKNCLFCLDLKSENRSEERICKRSML